MDLFATHTLNYKVCCGFLAGCEDQSSAMNLWFKIDTRISSLFKFGTDVLFQLEELVTVCGPVQALPFVVMEPGLKGVP